MCQSIVQNLQIPFLDDNSCGKNDKVGMSEIVSCKQDAVTKSYCEVRGELNIPGRFPNAANPKGICLFLYIIYFR